MSSTTFRSADGVRLAADVAGPDGAPVVILMHGGGQTRHSWSGAMRALAAQGYRVINYDARGHGESDWSPDAAYSLDDRVADLRAVMHGITAPVALVGASLGGATAMQAVASGIRPAAIVLVDIVPHPEPAGISRIVKFMHAHPTGFSSLDEAADAVAAYNPDRPRTSDPSGLMRNLREGPEGRLLWHWDPEIIATNPDVHHRKILAAATRMAAIDDLPVTLVRGLRSEVVSAAGVDAFRRLMSRLEVIDVAEAGHMVAGDRNDAFNAGVLAFLGRVMPSTRRS